MSCNAKKDPNGTWRIQYRWTDWTGTKKKSQKRGFKTKKEAEEWYAHFMLQQSSDPTMTLADFWEIYKADMMDMSSDDVGNIYDIMIFAIGQIAFAESAISNYKSMYKKLKEEKKDEVEKYLEGVDKQYEKNEEMIRSDIKEAKNFVGEIVDLWSEINWKQRIKVVGVLLAFIGFYVLLIWISTLLSNI